MITVILVLVLAAFIVAVASITSPPRAPLWAAVILLCVVELLRVLPLK